MKVTCSDFPDSLKIRGELFTDADKAIFVPKIEPYGKHRLTLFHPTVILGGDQEIRVHGFRRVDVDGDETLFRQVMYNFTIAP